MKKIFFAVLFFVGLSTLFAQNLPDVNKVSDELIYISVEVKPEFPGGKEAFYKYIGSNFVAPEDVPLKGKMVASFIVEKDGSLADIKITKDEIGNGAADELNRLLTNSPKWVPGIENGKIVRVFSSVPITFGSED